MRRFYFLTVVICLALAGQTRAVDLATIDRSLRKEPAYESKQPQYCLLVFGTEAKTRVWVVLDGDVLYLDRNGNGDLTDPGERIAAREVYRNSEERPDVEVMRHFELNCWKAGDEPVLTCGPEVQWFYILQIVPRTDWYDETWVKFWQERPFDFAVTTKTGYAQRAQLRFAISPQERRFSTSMGRGVSPSATNTVSTASARGSRAYLGVELHTQGLNATVRTDILKFPKTSTQWRKSNSRRAGRAKIRSGCARS